ncbi:FAD:protein FMN transferase [Castellaniella sp.]|uniref:FAD:protein FMN transferase n=1 Tax=Castellaniella sp. TaxID=1955812 RepID=UPI00355FA7F1
MTPATPSRRRFLGILAASSALLGTAPLHAALRIPEPVIWRGVALGADAQLQILHPDRSHAEALVRMAVAEVHRLERIFSLYREDSALVRLNRDGHLALPPAELAELLTRALAFAEQTAGHFDPSVQPLWALYATHARTGQALPPDPGALQAALAQVDYRAIRLDDDGIALERPGMALTLNGIAQGYITDRVTELLQAHGLDRALVDMGETRALGAPGADRPWRAGIADPDQPGHLLQILPLDGPTQALATSGGYGTPLDPSGRFTHLFNPRSGSAVPLWRSVTVRAADATTADALSTAFSHMPEAKIRGIVERLPIQAWLLPEQGHSLQYLA